MKMKVPIPRLQTITIATPCFEVKENSGKKCTQRLNTQDHREEGHIVAGEQLMLLEGRQAGRYRTKISMMMVDSQFVVEVAGEEEGVVSARTHQAVVTEEEVS